jgi:transcriptional regulator with XRE-family HTH domain
MNLDLTENHTATVCLDGNEVKRQRELHGLTQLYVSKVVGVTTDTISRWENNRYPTIRRENALNLAEALEVTLEQILRKPPDDVLPETPPSVKKSYRLIFAAVFLCFLIGLAAWIFYVRQAPIAVNVEARRILPDFAAPLTAIPVQLKLVRHEDKGGFILREDLPPGWKLTEAFPPPSSLDNEQGIVRWIVKAGDTTNKVVYLVQVQPSSTAVETVAFSGEIISGSGNRQVSAPVEGESQIRVAPVHWADSDGDGRIDDVEMLDTSYTVDEMSGINIDWDALERLWDAEGYRWDQALKKFVPLHAETASP